MRMAFTRVRFSGSRRKTLTGHGTVKLYKYYVFGASGSYVNVPERHNYVNII